MPLRHTKTVLRTHILRVFRFEDELRSALRLAMRGSLLLGLGASEALGSSKKSLVVLRLRTRLEGSGKFDRGGRSDQQRPEETTS